MRVWDDDVDTMNVDEENYSPYIHCECAGLMVFCSPRVRETVLIRWR